MLHAASATLMHSRGPINNNVALQLDEILSSLCLRTSCIVQVEEPSSLPLTTNLASAFAGMSSLLKT